MNCKPGDLAIIVGSFYLVTECNIGSIVRVICLAPHTKTSLAWLCVAEHSLTNQRGEKVQETTVGDCHLRPVSGIPITDDIKDEVTA